ncbi:nitrous oxidase accessory protein [Salegentibacter sp. 24]|uniref:nitrous oxide reductase family maturation protein NosD n=1 Tax=Salegentibacter sp. 24 TaxID=2183986 RepID=UPI00105D1B63|nr:nitrous oxide reductase family maturation protein NosD [Salegentibacter sp. 24]TDN83856.1 nitrous oxidase accessory protein [Salegentibacter sp. 24]
MKALLLIFLIFIGFNFYGGEITVCKSCEISSVKDAVEMAEMGDTIRVKSGLYKENNISIKDKSLVLIGEDFPVIDAQMQGYAIIVSAQAFRIEGFKIINIGRSHTSDFAAILISNSANFEIKNNRFDKIFFGILIERSKNGRIIGNKFSGNAKSQAHSGNAIHLWKTSEMHIEDNQVEGVRDGIYLEFSDNAEIKNNVCKNNLRYGLHFMFSDGNIYSGNLFENNGAGVAVMYSKNIKMYRNTFKNNWGSASYGLLLKEITDSELIQNTFEENTVGISADNTSRINYIENNFKSNGYAVKIRGGCYRNVFKRNNFLYNSFDLTYHGHSNENSFNGNFWSNYSGYDLDKDSFGDIPYRPVSLFSYLVNKTPESIVMLRSLFIDLIEFSEKVSPIFTPADVLDSQPFIKKIQW